MCFGIGRMGDLQSIIDTGGVDLLNVTAYNDNDDDDDDDVFGGVM